MYRKKECVAMLLAGGQGSRLYVLTEKTAKPAVPFGGKYRIIDFTLSNCINSGIDTVGVLTQYQPLVLNEYIGNGQPWDLDRAYGGVTILPPYQGKKGGDWYRGTANAIYQNFTFIDRYRPEYVLVLSGDHIYKMDYLAMLSHHKSKQADCTIGVIDVPLSDASRFGIMSAEQGGRIYDFEEKPKKPKSTKASMGIYIFNRNKLLRYLERDDADPGSSNDFGKNIIPAMLAAGESMYAYPFTGYWKDVGTLDSLWQANMDLLGENPALDLGDDSWRIFSRNSTEPPHFTGEGSSIKNSLINGGCEIFGEVENSILSSGVKVAAGARVKDSVVMQNAAIGENATVLYSIIDSDANVGKGALIGREKEQGGAITVVGAQIEINTKAQIAGGSMLSAGAAEEGTSK